MGCYYIHISDNAGIIKMIILPLVIHQYKSLTMRVNNYPGFFLEKMGYNPWFLDLFVVIQNIY